MSQRALILALLSALGCNGDPVPDYPLANTYRLAPGEAEALDCALADVVDSPVVLTGVFPERNALEAEAGTLTFLDQRLGVQIEAPTTRGNGESPWGRFEEPGRRYEHSSGLRWGISEIQFRTRQRQGEDALHVHLEGNCSGVLSFLPDDLG